MKLDTDDGHEVNYDTIYEIKHEIRSHFKTILKAGDLVKVPSFTKKGTWGLARLESEKLNVQCVPCVRYDPVTESLDCLEEFVVYVTSLKVHEPNDKPNTIIDWNS